jgi:hypothetical protein
MSSAVHARPTATPGWFKFAAILFTISGIANVVWGLHALDSHGGLSATGLMWTSLKTWGWISIIWGAIALGTAALLFRSSGTGAGVGVIISLVTATFWLFVMPALPIFALVAIAVNITVIYGLIVGVGELDAAAQL